MEPPRELFLPLLNNPTEKLSEDELLLVWKYLCPRLSKLTTVTDKSLVVRDPGRIKRLEGPDVRGVDLELNGVARSGAVEIHRQTADWYHHEHHCDPAFNGVVLHVVMTGERINVRREDNNWVETVVLEDHLSSIESMLESLDRSILENRRKAVKRPCYREDPDPETIRSRLNEAGRVWLDKRAARFRKDRDDTLLQATIGALGYGRNHEEFRTLGSRLEFSRFRSVCEEETSSDVFEGYLLGKGGWFDRSGTFNETIYRRRRRWRGTWSDERAVVDVDTWNRSGVRPHARPIRRWVNFGWTLRRLRKTNCSWIEWVRMVGRRCLSDEDFRKRLHGELREVFGFAPGSYWKFHYSLSDCRRQSVPSAVGSAWFDQLIVNVLLPFLYSLTFINGRPDRRASVVEAFMHYPATLRNRRTRRMKQQWGFGDDTDVYGTVAQQQGAVHVYKQGCVPGRCGRCKLKRDGARTARPLFDTCR